MRERCKGGDPTCLSLSHSHKLHKTPYLTRTFPSPPVSRAGRGKGGELFLTETNSRHNRLTVSFVSPVITIDMIVSTVLGLLAWLGSSAAERYNFDNPFYSESGRAIEGVVKKLRTLVYNKIYELK